MRRELIRAGAVESLNIGLQDMMKSEVQSNVRYVSLATNEYLWALRATVKLVGQEEKSAISEDLEKRGVRWLLHALFNSLDGKGFPLENSTPATPAKYAQDIACLAVSQINAGILLKLGGVSVLSRTVIADWSEQTRVNMQSDPIGHAEALRYASLALSHLSYIPEAQDEMLENEEMVAILRTLSDAGENPVNLEEVIPRTTPRAADKKDAAAPDAGDHQSDPDYIQAMQMAKKHARLILFQLEDVKTREAREGDEGEPGDDGEAGQIMLSYCWGDQDPATGKFPNQEKVRRIKDALEARGYATWMDVDKMQGSTLNAMANAVEASAAVCIVMTKQYKESDACRMEADYSYQLRKKTILLKAEVRKHRALLPDHPQR